MKSRVKYQGGSFFSSNTSTVETRRRNVTPSKREKKSRGKIMNAYCICPNRDSLSNSVQHPPLMDAQTVRPLSIRGLHGHDTRSSTLIQHPLEKTAENTVVTLRTRDEIFSVGPVGRFSDGKLENGKGTTARRGDSSCRRRNKILRESNFPGKSKFSPSNRFRACRRGSTIVVAPRIRGRKLQLEKLLAATARREERFHPYSGLEVKV